MKKNIYKTLFVCLVLFALGNTNTISAQDIINLKITSPGDVDWTIDAIKTANDHGVQITEDFSGEIVRAFDGVTDVSDNDTWSPFGSFCCDSIVNPGELAGKIALIGRGTCSFSDKIWNAEKAGAVGVIIANRAPIGLVTGTHNPGLIIMAGTAPASDSITIPAIFITYEDRIEIESRLDQGPVMATMEAADLYDPHGPYAYSTPIDQVRPLDLGVVAFTRTGDTLYNVTFRAEITEPGGGSTVLTELEDTLLPGKDWILGTVHDPLIKFTEEYTPSELGTYTILYSVSTEDGGEPIDNAELTKTFEITDYTFALDNGTVTDADGMQMNYTSYQTEPPIHDVGSFFQMGPNGGTATYASFALANIGALDIGGGFEFKVKIYKADLNGDGNPDDDMTVAIDSFIYAVNGSEVPNEPVYVDLGMLDLMADSMYCIMVESGGFLFTDVIPEYTTAGSEVYPRKASAYRYGDAFQSSGYEYWNSGSNEYPHGGRAPVVRLHMAGFEAPVALEVLPEDQVDVFPTLSSEVVNVKFDLNERTANVFLIVTDVNGRTMYIQEHNNIMDETISLYVNNYPNGNYFLTIKTDKGVRTNKFVVVK